MLPICRHGGRRGTTPTFATIFHFTTYSQDYSASNSEDEAWGMLTMQIRWTIATRPVIEYGSEQRISFPTCQDLAILNSYILLSSCGRKKISHRNFRLTLIREMRARSGHELRPSMPVEKPAPASTTSENWIRVTISTRRAAVT